MITTLIVEDNGEFRLFLKGLLSERFPGAVFAEADDGRSALDMLTRIKPDIMIVDIGLPGGMNGLKLTEHVRRSGQRPPIVVITNHSLPEYQAAALRAGADCFLPKAGSTKEQILTAVERLLSGASPAPTI